MQWAFTGRDEEYARAARVLNRNGPRGVLVAGEAGVGKSRLLAELAVGARRSGFAVTRIYASSAAASIPFGAFADVLPDSNETEMLPLLRQVRRALRDGAAQGRAIVIVDDVHALDEGSVALVQQLTTTDEVRVVASARHDLRVSPTITGLWKDGHIDRLELGPLRREAFDRLVHAAFPGAVPHSMVESLWTITLGHPLYLRVLTDAALDAGTLVLIDDAWHWEGPPTEAPRLLDLVRERTGMLDEPSQRALELLALGEPLPSPVADIILDRSARSVLEGRRLISEVDDNDLSSDDGGEPALRTSHPLFAEVIVAGLGPSVRKHRARALAEAWQDQPSPSAPLHAARWAMEAGSPLPRARAEAAARDAIRRFDFALAEQLSRAALDADATHASTHLLLADALRHQGAGAEALPHLERAIDLAPDDDTRTKAAITLAETASLQLGDMRRALAVLRDAADRVTDPEAHRRIELERTYLGTFSGDLREVVDAAPASIDGTADPAAELELAVMTTFAQALTLQLGDVEARVERGLELAVELAPTNPMASHQLGVSRVLALVGAGRLTEAFELAAAGLDGTTTGSAPTGLWAVAVAFAGSFTGQLDAAVDAGIEAVASLREADPFGLLPIATSIGSVTAIQARRTGSVPKTPGRDAATVDPLALAVVDDRVRAWTTIAAGDLDEGGRQAAEAGIRAIGASHCLWGLTALHDTVRIGQPSLAIDALRALVETCDSALAQQVRFHAEALGADDRDALVRVAERYATMGSPLFAAEVDAQRSGLELGAGNEAASARAATRAWLRWEPCTGAVPPALASAPSGLSPRERSLVPRLCAGRTSREIAEDLVLSVRTVDNHLRRMYRTLDVSGRDELADLFADVVAPE